MLFNSIEFLIFFILTYVLYGRLQHRGQNRLLLIASYLFYGAWDWRFLGLIWLSTAIDYYCGIKIDKVRSKRTRKWYLILSIVTNLGILGLFKYFNFFSESLIGLAGLIGWHLDAITLKLILPIGISFYTFQSMSYTIDVYRRELRPTRAFLDFALYVAFFPQLVAGPIERAKRLLPQFSRPRKKTQQQFREGIWLISWGLYKKVFIADNLARIVDSVFVQSGTFSGAEVLLGVYAFAFQIYCDFSGYSDMARGLAKLFGIELMRNFNLPYFVVRPGDFWRHWHISLSSWLRDYLYIPLGGNRGTTPVVMRNLLLTMLLGGLWHGASWTFVLWGAYHGILLISFRVIEKNNATTSTNSSLSHGIWHLMRIIFMFHLTCLGWLIFRAQSMGQISVFLQNLFFHFEVGRGLGLGGFVTLLQTTWLLLAVQCIRQWWGERFRILSYPTFMRAAVFALIFYSIVWHGAIGGKEFIYFQF